MTRRRSKVARTLRRVLTENVGLKLFSIVAAFVLFWVIRGTLDSERSIFIQVEHQLPGPSSSRMLVSDLPDRVKVTIRGSRAVLESIEPGDLPPVQVDVRKAQHSYYYFEPEDFELPATVRVVRLAPASIPLKWAHRIAKRVPVRAALVGQPGPGLQARPVRIEPATVEITGPERQLTPVRDIDTKDIDVSGLEVGTHERKAPLKGIPPHTKVEPERVDVTLEVAVRQAERTLHDLSVVAKGASSVQFRPRRVDVTLWGSATDLEALDFGDLKAVADVSRYEPGAGMEEVEVQIRGIPPGVQARPAPAAVLVVSHGRREALGRSSDDPRD